DPQGEVLHPGDDEGPGALDLLHEVGQRPERDVVGLGVGVLHAVLARSPVGRVDHRGDVVDLGGHARDVLGDLVGAGGGDAEHGGRQPGAGGVDPLPALGEEADDGVFRLPVLARVDDLLERVRPADVVVHDVVDAEAGRLFGQRHVVLPNVGIEGVREAAVLAVGGAVGILDDPVQVPVLHRVVGQPGIAEVDDPPYHPHALGVELLDGLLEVVQLGDGADLVGELDPGVVPHVAALVLQVELHGVYQPGVDHLHDRVLQLGRRPGPARGVDADHRWGTGSAGEGQLYRHQLFGGVAHGIGGGYDHAGVGGLRVRLRDGPVLVGGRLLPVDGDGGDVVGGDPDRHGHLLVHGDRVGGGEDLDRRGCGVEHELPGGPQRPERETAVHDDGETMLPVGQPAQVDDEGVGSGLRRLELLVVDGHRHCGRVGLLGQLDRDVRLRRPYHRAVLQPGDLDTAPAAGQEPDRGEDGEGKDGEDDLAPTGEAISRARPGTG